MTYNLGRLTRQRGIRRKNIVLRPVTPPRAYEQDAEVLYRRIVEGWEQQLPAILEAYARAVAALRLDDDNTLLEAALAAAALAQSSRVVVEVTEGIRHWIVRYEEWHRQRWAAAVKSGTGVDIFPFIDIEAAQVELDAALNRNAALIRGLDEEARKKVETQIWQGLVSQTPRRDMAKILANELGISQRRALFIAQDQTVKLSGHLDKIRQEEAGIAYFTWRSSEDSRVRPLHQYLNRKVFKWSNPPSEGYPGTPPRCRCKAQATLSPED